MRIVIAAIVCVMLVSCSSNPSTEAFRVQSFIPLDSIMAAQKGLLMGKNLSKSVTIDDELEQSLVSIDSGFIDDEWSFLQEFDLNKPGFVGGIEVIENGGLVRYEPKPNQSYLLNYLQYRFGEEGEIVEITGALKDEKAKSLYESTREFKLEFSEGVVKKYMISGYQKIVMKDTVYFQVTGEIQ